MENAGHPGLIPKHGGYRKLKSFQIAQLVYDLTVRFCGHYISTKSRTRDQMVQAARSGTQNIAEGSQVSATSKKMEMKLTGVARASLEELRLDYEDFLRQRKLPIWDRNDPRRVALIALRPQTEADVAEWAHEVHGSGEHGHGRASGKDGASGEGGLRRPRGQGGRGSGFPESTPSTESTESTESARSTPSTVSQPPTYPEILANAALALISVSTALLSRQLASQAAAFEAEGGFTERLYRERHKAKVKP